MLQNVMYRRFAFSQTELLRTETEDRATARGVCSALTYDWIKLQLAGLKVHYSEQIKNLLYHAMSHQRAYASRGREGLVAERVAQLEQRLPPLSRKKDLEQFQDQDTADYIGMLAQQDGLRTAVKDVDDLLDEFAEIPVGQAKFEGAQEQAILEREQQIMIALTSMAWYLSFPTRGSRHAVGLHFHRNGATFFDANYGVFYNKTNWLSLIWLFSNHLPLTYGVKPANILCIAMFGSPRDAAAIKEVSRALG